MPESKLPGFNGLIRQIGLVPAVFVFVGIAGLLIEWWDGEIHFTSCHAFFISLGVAWHYGMTSTTEYGSATEVLETIYDKTRIALAVLFGLLAVSCVIFCLRTKNHI
jgi:hypothetical protein